MMAAPKRATAPTALTAMAYVVLGTFVVGALYVGKDILIPLALAALLTFLLSPLVSIFERWVGRVASVLLIVLVLLAAVTAGGWVLTQQVIDLATKLPDYQQNIHHKLQSLQMPSTGRFGRTSKAIQELEKDFPGSSGKDAAAHGSGRSEADSHPDGAGSPGPSATKPMPVEIVTPADESARMVGGMASRMLGPFGTGALVLLLVIFMLLKREDVRGRLIRLIGQGHISSTTRAMEDAGTRVSRYLLMQLLVNFGFGTFIAIGLLFIGVPNAILWGILAAVLRFVPYIGTWIAAALPFTLSLAASSGWKMPLLALGLFVVLDLSISNAIEPLLYGSSTGVSSIALILAAVFWTWLWGTVGLVMATPLTVCLVVMGRHVPKLQFLSVLLSDEDALSRTEECYHRLLAGDLNGASRLSEKHLKEGTLGSLYDTILLPVVVEAEKDFAAGRLDEEQRTAVEQGLRDIITDNENLQQKDVPTPSAAVTVHVACLPARTDRDEIAGAMLTQILQQGAFAAMNVPGKLTTGEAIGEVEKEHPDAVVISVVPPSTVIHARFLCAKLRARFSKLKIVVCLIGLPEAGEDASERLRAAGADDVVSSLEETVALLARYSALLAQETLLTQPGDETNRLLELDRLNLIDSPPDPDLDRITARLARMFDMPIALISFVSKDRQFFKSQFGLENELAEARSTSRDVSVCAEVVATNDILVVEDLARDRRFANNALLNEKGLRFYAGTPLRGTNGEPLGSLCVLDHTPRRFGEHERRVLTVTADEVMDVILHRTSGESAVTSPPNAS